MGDRARITIPDIVITVGVLAILGILYPVFASGLGNNLTEMSTPTIWMFRLMLPMALLVILSRLFRKAIVGGGQR
jgi:hypothetical protein